MPVREKKRERTAGLFVLIGLVLLGVLIVEFGRFGDRFRGSVARARTKAFADDASHGLSRLAHRPKSFGEGYR